MGGSIDGGLAIDGKSAGLGSDGDQRIFAILRDLADVLLVGAGTIRAEGYGGIRLDPARRARRLRGGTGAPTAPPRGGRRGTGGGAGAAPRRWPWSAAGGSTATSASSPTTRHRR